MKGTTKIMKKVRQSWKVPHTFTVTMLIVVGFFAFMQSSMAPAKAKIDKPSEVRGIYMTVSTYNSPAGKKLLDNLVKNGGNAVTLDIETGNGRLAFRPKIKMLKKLNAGGDEMVLEDVVNDLHKRGLYAIARQVVFKDPYVAKRVPRWRIKGYNSQWLDPSMPGAQNYNLMVIKELAIAGFDEVQLDYIRFPTGFTRYLNFHYDEKNFTRADIINDFLSKAREVTNMHGTKLAVDVFGGVVFGEVDWKIVGQHIPTLAKYVDVIYPMTYPSHYSPGFYGYYNMYYEPYDIVFGSVDRFVNKANEHLTENDQVAPEIRPYIQGFSYRAYNFGTEYIQKQINASRDAGGKGFMIWNAKNWYEPSWPALKEKTIPEEITN